MIVIDVETSGTSPYKHSILSIGAIDFSNPERRFYQECRIEKDKEYTEEALNVNGFKKEALNDPKKKSLENVLNEFIEWIKPIEDKTIGGHNVNFDAGFLNYSFKKYEIPFSFGHRVIDTHSLVYASILSRGLSIPLKDEKTDINSDYVFGYAGLPPEPKPHNALNGAKMEAESLSRLIFGKKLLEEYKAYEIPAYLLKNN
ncbi:MAG: 3'-5' exonuclease [Candidatus Parvarchaeota archaeon]|jgi:DNA polymerase III epsilon subunit-like protein|nr:3'-5' exonuclease [Candidatus Parvarchaeota archaeon]